MHTLHRVAYLLAFIAGIAASVFLTANSAQPEQSTKSFRYETFVLTDNRLCKACRVQPVDAERVQLIDRAGNRSTVSKKEVLGVDRHPFWRKTVSHMVHGVGLPGMVIVPGAFQDAKEYVCKYCDTQE